MIGGRLAGEVLVRLIGLELVRQGDHKARERQLSHEQSQQDQLSDRVEHEDRRHSSTLPVQLSWIEGRLTAI